MMDDSISVGNLLEGFYDIYDNSSEDEDCCDGGDVCDLEDGMQFEALFIPVLYSIVFVVGVLGNGVLLGVLARSRKSWSVTDTFILHLCIADVLLLVTLPFWAAESAHADGWIFGTPLCKITGAVFTVSHMQSGQYLNGETNVIFPLYTTMMDLK